MITQSLTPFDSTKQAIEGTASFRANASYSWSWLIKHTNQQITLISQINNTLSEMNGLSQTVTTKAQEVANDKTTVNQAKSDAVAAAEAAVIAKNEAQSLYDNFDDRYLGPFLTPPTLDNDDQPLKNGALFYLYTESPEDKGNMYIYDLQRAEWIDISYIPTLFSSLTDILLAGLETGDILKYDKILGKWQNIPRDYYNKTETDNKLNQKAELDNPVFINLALPDTTKIQNQNISPFTGFKNRIINGAKLINRRGTTNVNNSYNYDFHYKVGNNWFIPVPRDNIISGVPHVISWEGTATAGYYIGTASSITINSQTFIPISKEESIVPTIPIGSNIWFKFASDATATTFNLVQFEEGTTPSPYEHRFGIIESVLCKSRFQIIRQRVISTQNTGGLVSISTTFPVEMSGTPSVAIVQSLSNSNVSNNVVGGLDKYGLHRQLTAFTNGNIDFDVVYSLSTEL